MAEDVTPRTRALHGQTVLVIGGSVGIALATARHARAAGADVVLAARNAERLQQARHELRALRTAVLDVKDPAAVDRFFHELPRSIARDIEFLGRGAKFTYSLSADTRPAGRYVDPLATSR